MRWRVAMRAGSMLLPLLGLTALVQAVLLGAWAPDPMAPWQAFAVGQGAAAVAGAALLGPVARRDLRQRDAVARLRRVALTDPLTGVANRRAFLGHAAACLGPGGETRRFAVLLIDLDRFKALNDNLGHEVGDAALAFAARQIGGALARAGEHDALLARVGGEEFAVFLEGAGAASATRAADAICAGLRANRFVHNGRWVGVTVSIGVWAGCAGGIDGPLAAADRAVYAAKARGRDRWELAWECKDDPPTAEVRRLAV